MSTASLVKRPEIYKKDSKGKTRVWFVEIDMESGAFRQVNGVKGGNLTVQGWTQAEPKNTGKANATTAVQQAEIEVDALYKKKLKKGYFEDVEEIGSFDKFKPMLALDYEDYAEKIEFPVGQQPKLDGIRCAMRADGLWTRSFEPINSCQHVMRAFDAVKDLFPGIVFDGELYNHAYKERFNELSGLIRTQELTDEKRAEIEGVVQLHIYDAFNPAKPDAPFEERIQILEVLKEALRTKLGEQSVIQFVPTRKSNTQQDLDAAFEAFLADGYEGQMVRRLNAPYGLGKRSKDLLKRKLLVTEEFPVVAVEEGKGSWAGHVKRFICRMPNGETFGAGPNGSKAQMKELFESGVTPDWATVQYQPVKSGKPRIPTVKDYGQGERRD